MPKVWIEQDLWTGDALCTEIVSELFVMGSDNLAYVKDSLGVYDGLGELPPGPRGLATFALDDVELVYEAAEDCPGECIFMEDDEGNSIGPVESIRN